MDRSRNNSCPARTFCTPITHFILLGWTKFCEILKFSPARFLLLSLKLPLLPVGRTINYVMGPVRKYEERRFDAEFGVDTSGPIEPQALRFASPEQTQPYVPVDPDRFQGIMRRLGIRFEEFTFLDFGSGKGRALLLASQFPFKQILGVEWSEELHRVAQRNIRSYRGPRLCKRVESFHGDARTFAIPPDPALLFFFNPFKEAIMREVLNNIRKSLEEHAREVIIVYQNPRFGEIFDGADFLTRVVRNACMPVWLGGRGGCAVCRSKVS